MASPTILILTLALVIAIAIPFLAQVIDDVTLLFRRDVHGIATVTWKYHLRAIREQGFSGTYAYDRFDHWFVHLRLGTGLEEEIEVKEDMFDSVFQGDAVEVIYRIRPISRKVWIWDMRPPAAKDQFSGAS